LSPKNCDQNVAKLCWRKAKADSVQRFKLNVTQDLQNIAIPYDSITCTDISCINHNNDISRYCEELISVLTSNSEKCIPKCKPPCRSSTPGWNEHVRQYKDASIFWHAIWKDCGSPSTGCVAQIRRKARGEYHRAIRRVKRDRDKIIANKMASSLIFNDHRDLWAECRFTKSTPFSVDGISGDSDIASVFARNYETLYNSVSYEDEDMRSVEKRIDDRVMSLCHNQHCYDSHSVDFSDLKRAVSFLKHGKSYGILSTDH